ncbi:hypothetical protein CHLRE_03g165801v5 [Chlamydomonas reinhardtii]|uniref:BTB domain-containing protein n=1 Tax=Chlamydomonas reinhardtii TaxID=3055 RepID=A0A2K3DWP7_CHLRE|nr:uncharacterized protein CHLRE_03g165801v5 [Chlamydomonas reinhardtii]PNW84961.1 hypothetical protein CHLRE_03g165801v5 [Chlamydomonas reinhardtii]
MQGKLQQPAKAAAVRAAAPGSCLVTLAILAQQPQQHGRNFLVDRALLWHASPVLRGLMEDVAGGNATLPLVGDDPADWRAALSILQHTGMPVSWDNVGALLRLADKYDMDAVRSACAVFLGSKASAAAVDLSHPLESARNLLHAASLVERYLGGGGSNSGGGGGGSSSGGGSGGSTMQHDLQPYTAVMPSALQAALQPLHNQLEKSSSVHYNSYPYHKGYGASQAQPGSARAVISALQTLQANPRYNDIVAPGVQGQVVAALLACLDQLFQKYNFP